jgi:hypothetical protein
MCAIATCAEYAELVFSGERGSQAEPTDALAIAQVDCAHDIKDPDVRRVVEQLDWDPLSWANCGRTAAKADWRL